jgi:hypothetical protein
VGAGFDSYVSTLQCDTNVEMVKLFPNPANTEITVDFGNKDQSNHVIICNSLGQVIEEYDSRQNFLKIPTGDFAEGIYFLMIENSEYTFTDAFIISH